MNSPESTLERDLRAIDDALAGAPRDPDPGGPASFRTWRWP